MSPLEQDELLSLYLEAELAGEDAAARYPAFAALLARDAALAADVAALRRALIEAAGGIARGAGGAGEADARAPRALREAPAAYAAPASPVSVESAPQGPLWSARVFARPGGGPLRIQFAAQAALLARFSGAADDGAARVPRPLLAQSVALGGASARAEAHAEVRAAFAAAPPRFYLEVALATPAPLPLGSSVLLLWNDEAHAAALDADDRAELGEVALPAALARLEVAFDVPV